MANDGKEAALWLWPLTPLDDPPLSRFGISLDVQADIFIKGAGLAQYHAQSDLVAFHVRKKLILDPKKTLREQGVQDRDIFVIIHGVGEKLAVLLEMCKQLDVPDSVPRPSRDRGFRRYSEFEEQVEKERGMAESAKGAMNIQIGDHANVGTVIGQGNMSGHVSQKIGTGGGLIARLKTIFDWLRKLWWHP